MAVSASDPRFHPRWRSIALLALLSLALLLYLHHGRHAQPRDHGGGDRHGPAPRYNATYPLSPPQRTAGGGLRYRIGVIADLDTASRSAKEQTWFSYMRRGHLTVEGAGLQVDWDQEQLTLESHLAERGRGTTNHH